MRPRLPAVSPVALPFAPHVLAGSAVIALVNLALHGPSAALLAGGAALLLGLAARRWCR